MTDKYKIICADCITGMKTLPDGCIHTCITSPPYYGLRDYDGGDAEIGGEETPEQYVQKMVEVFREVRRILRDDGTLWLNLGDSYATTSGGMEQLRKMGEDTPAYGKIKYAEGYKGVSQKGKAGAKREGLKHKDLIGIPWRVALALQADGWYLRQDIIWNKPNPMPESVTDRCTRSHEYIFMLTKQPKYYYDHEAIKEPCTSKGGGSCFGKISMKEQATSSGQQSRRYERPDYSLTGKNRRSVWTVTTKAYKGAHFATYPKDLIEPCVLAGCPAGGTVFDPFTGSGTTAVVALTHGRNYIGTELNPEYVKLAEARIAEEVPNTLEGMMQ
jgi:DNA modification methylase